MDLLQTITTITEYIAEGIVGLLALDNAVDMLAKLFGNKQIDTLCGKFALWLNDLYTKVKPVNVPPASSGTSATVTTTPAPTGAIS